MFDYDTIELEYSGIEVEWASGSRDYWDGSYSREGTAYVDVTLTVSQKDVEEFLADLLGSEEKYADMDDTEFAIYVHERFDELVSQYEDEIYDAFREDAESKARDEFDPDDYDDYYDDDYYDDDF